MNQLIDTWSSRADEEDSMTDEHEWIWREMIAAIPWPSDANVLDIGCNQGGFLRLLHDKIGLTKGVGIDLARQAVERANQHKGARPLSYLASGNLSDAGQDFNAAVSHEVIYLIPDLIDHAQQVARVLRPGSSYYAITCCHADMPLWSNWRNDIQQFSNIPVPNHSIADISGAFRETGFEVSINRFLASAFVPLSAPSSYFPTEKDRLETYTRWKLMFKFTK